MSPRTKPPSPPKIPKLTQKQASIHRTLIRYTEDHGYPPSVKALCDALGSKFSNGVYLTLDILARKGYISRENFTARGIKILLDENGLPYKPKLDRELTALFTALKECDLDSSVMKQIRKIEKLM